MSNDVLQLGPAPSGNGLRARARPTSREQLNGVGGLATWSARYFGLFARPLANISSLADQVTVAALLSIERLKTNRSRKSDRIRFGRQ